MNYLFSANHSTDAGAEKIEAAKMAARVANNQAKAVGSPVRLRVVYSPRKGSMKRHEWKYNCLQMKGKKWRLEDMSHVDVYLLRKD